MADPSRFEVVAILEPLGGFRRAVAVDRERDRAVVFATASAGAAADPAARAALRARAGAASGLRHPGLAVVLGSVEVDGALAVLEEHRPGVTIQALVSAAGRLPADVAARAVLDAAEGLARAHAVDAGAGTRLAHGAVDATSVVVGDEGPAFVSGLGLAAGATPAADVRALGAVLHECLSGEPAGTPPRRLDVPGIPGTLAAAVDRATGAEGPPFASIAALAEAVSAAITPASHDAVAAYADAVVPPDAGARADVRRALSAALVEPAEEVSAELVVDPEPAPAPARASVAAADAVRLFAAPRRPPARERLPLAIGAIALGVGFAVGFLAQRATRAPEPPATLELAPGPAAAPPKAP